MLDFKPLLCQDNFKYHDIEDLPVWKAPVYNRSEGGLAYGACTSECDRLNEELKEKGLNRIKVKVEDEEG